MTTKDHRSVRDRHWLIS